MKLKLDEETDTACLLCGWMSQQLWIPKRWQPASLYCDFNPENRVVRIEMLIIRQERLERPEAPAFPLREANLPTGRDSG